MTVLMVYDALVQLVDLVIQLGVIRFQPALHIHIAAGCAGHPYLPLLHIVYDLPAV